MLITKRLEAELERNGGLSDELDVQNAFNSIPWQKVIEALQAKTIPQYLVALISDYLTDRWLVLEGKETQITAGVPQGSILGPLLWNIVYDSLLYIDFPVGVRAQAYADDLVLTTVGRTEELAVELTNNALDLVQSWMSANGLKLASEKTEAVLLGDKRRPKDIAFNLNGTVIRPKDSLNYLGVLFDRGRTWTTHLTTVTDRATRKLQALSRLLPNVSPLESNKRKVLLATLSSIVLYAAPIWIKALERKKNVQLLAAVHRKICIKAVSASRTVATEAVQALASDPLLDLVARERASLWGPKINAGRRNKLREQNNSPLAR